MKNIQYRTEEDEEGYFDLGERKATKQNDSTVVCLPKVFTDKYLGKSRKVRVTMNGDRLCIRPVTGDKK
tara:strand:+ start:599 stop:805 length:207 start_codon:yes stop_codon:yes gene_type:complete